MKPDVNNGIHFTFGKRGIFQQRFDGFSPSKLEKAYALFNQKINNPNHQVGSTGFLINMFYPPSVKRGSRFDFGDYDIFNQGFGNSFSTMKKRQNY